MKVINESNWQGRLAVMAADPDPLAQKMMKFLPTWAEAAEKLMDKTIDVADHESGPPGTLLPIEALRRALPEAEVKAWGGDTPALILGQALIMLGNDWEPVAKDKEAYVDSLTTIETRMMIDVAKTMISVMQQKAAASGQSD